MLPFDFPWQMMVRLIVAAGLGGIVGYERESSGKPAGVRTHGIVALGAALFTLASLYGFGATEPSHVAAQVVTGIGFIGAGAILHLRDSVHGLTTAASLWVTAAIGLTAGAGMYLVSIEGAILAFLLLRFGPRSDGTPSVNGPP